MTDRTRRLLRHAVAGALSLALAGCAGGGASALPTSTDATPTHRPGASARPLATVPPSQPSVTGEVPAAILDPILANAAERLSVSPDQLTILVGEQVTWPDGSLGCPEPGMSYTQALVDGYQVVVEGGGSELDYRVGAGGGFRICEGGRRPSGG